MSIQKTLTRKRDTPGSLGVVQRTIGYLQGGYKDSTIHSKVQLFNTVTQTGALVYDTGVARNYRPGVSGNYTGYFSIDDVTNFNKFNFITASAAASFSMPMSPNVTAGDHGIFTQAWLLSTGLLSWSGAVIDWTKLDLTTDTPVSKGNKSPEGYCTGTTRQAIGCPNAGFFLNPIAASISHIAAINFATEVISNTTHSSILDNGMQYPCGMSVNATTGYFVGFAPRNVLLTFDGTTILSEALSTSYTYNFGESHSVATNTDGYMMAGYNDTSGRYGGSQHGLCQKITFTTAAITTLPDLVLAQSSGQMMQGF